MGTLKPDHRFTAVAAALHSNESVTGHWEQELYKLLDGQSADADVVYAYDLYTEQEHRLAMDAFTLARATPEIIQSVTEVNVGVTRIYQYLFMDMTVFRDRLDRLSYAANYGVMYGVEEHVVERMRAGVMHGPDYLRWQYGVPNPEMDPRQIVRSSMVDALYRGMAHKSNSLTSGVTKEAAKWMQNSVKYASVLEELEPRSAKAGAEQLRIALQAKDVTYSVATSPVDPAEILH